MKRVYIHGDLAEKYLHSPYVFDVKTAFEASWAMEANYPGFHDDIRARMIEVVVGSEETACALEDEEHLHFVIPQDEIHFTPVPHGSKSRLVKAYIGIQLIAAAVFITYMTWGVGASWATMMASAAFTAGATMLTSAIIGPPKSAYSDRETDPRASSILGNPITTIEEGQSVPLILGGSEGVLCGGVVISASVDVQQL